MVSCITTPMTSKSQSSNLPLTMYTSNLLPVTCSKSVCTFNYQNYFTPYLMQIYPSTIVGDQQIQIDGYHRIADVGDGRSASSGQLRYILIDNAACSTLDILQDTFGGIYSQNSIFCKSFLNQEAGEYSLTERTIYGDALFAFRINQTSYFTGKNYSVRVTPAIDNSPSSNIPKGGGAYGHIFTLSGTGFGSLPANLSSYTCKIGEVACSVIYTSQSSIKIQLPPYQAGYETTGKLLQDPGDNSQQVKGYLGSFGVRYTRYTRNKWRDLGMLVYDLRAGNISETIIEDGYKTQVSYIYVSGVTNFIDYLRGYLYAPATGEYLF